LRKIEALKVKEQKMKRTSHELRMLTNMYEERKKSLEVMRMKSCKKPIVQRPNVQSPVIPSLLEVLLDDSESESPSDAVAKNLQNVNIAHA
jgi:hypothetical protein